MLVTIVAVPNATNTGLDTDRLEKVEDIHPDLAQKMLQGGTARKPSDEELDAYHKQLAADASTGADQAQDDRASQSGSGRAPKRATAGAA